MPVRAVGSTTDHTVRARDAPRARLGLAQAVGHEPEHDLDRPGDGRQHDDGQRQAGHEAVEAEQRASVLANGMISTAKMNRPATTDGRPLMASTKMRTGRRHLLRDLVEEHGGGQTERQRPAGAPGRPARACRRSRARRRRRWPASAASTPRWSWMKNDEPQRLDALDHDVADEPHAAGSAARPAAVITMTVGDPVDGDQAPEAVGGHDAEEHEERRRRRRAGSRTSRRRR